MTNVSGTPEKLSIRNALFEAAIQALADGGWKVERIPGAGKSSVRRITRKGVDKAVSIRTTQDTWIAFLRNSNDRGWKTLGEVDYVIAASVDDRHNPKFAQIHMIDGSEMRDRFDRAYAARKKAGHSQPLDRGIWVSLYEQEDALPVNRVGAGAGLKNPAIARVPLEADVVDRKKLDSKRDEDNSEGPLTIAEARRRLAQTFGVGIENISITIST